MTTGRIRRLRLLGPVSVDLIPGSSLTREIWEGSTAYGQDIPRFRSRRTIALLAYLVSEGRPFSREHLSTLFWPDEEPAKGRANLRRELHNLSKILPDCWMLEGQSVAFTPTSHTVIDTIHLEALLEEQRWNEASQLISGQFLEGFYLENHNAFEGWLEAERLRWVRHSEAVMGHVIEGHIRRGRYNDALAYAQYQLQRTPWNEALHRQVMRLLVWTGQRGAALHQYQSCLEALNEELGVEPNEATRQLFQRIKTGKLDLPPPVPAFLLGEKARRPYERPPLVGRHEALTWLGEFARATLAGQGTFVFVAGGPGRGKSTLLEALSQQVMDDHPDFLVASGRCHAQAGIGDPYHPFREILAMLTGDVEGLWDAGTISQDHAERLWTAAPMTVEAILDHGPQLLNRLVTGPGLLARFTSEELAPWLPRLREQLNQTWITNLALEQLQLFQQITRVIHHITIKQPLLLILDDIHWADSNSISLLFHLGRTISETPARLLVVCAYRPEELAPLPGNIRHPLAPLLGEFKRDFGDVWIDLGRTGESSRQSFVNDLLDIEPNRLDHEFRSRLFNRTLGHPLFTVELLRALEERGDLQKDLDGCWIQGQAVDWELLPARVEAVIHERIDRLKPDLQEMLKVASIEGEIFTAQVVAQITGQRERKALGQLSQNLQQHHRLVRELEEIETSQGRLTRYRFSHILFQEYLYKSLSQGERRLLHGEVAAALQTLYASELEEHSVELSHHTFQAGELEPAFHFVAMAAERARRLFDSAEAIRLYSQAIDLAATVTVEHTSKATVFRGRGQAYERLGDFDKAAHDYEIGLQIGLAENHERITWRAYLDLGKLWASRDYDQTRSWFEKALVIARKLEDPACLPTSLNWVGNWYANNNTPRTAINYHLEALEIFTRLGDQLQEAHTYDLLGMACLIAGDLVTSVEYYDRAIAIFQPLNDIPSLVRSLLGRVTDVAMRTTYASLPASSINNALADLEKARDIVNKINSAPDDAWACWSGSLVLMVNGEFGQALKVAQQGLHISSDIGHREWQVTSRVALGLTYAELFAYDLALEQLERAFSHLDELRSPYYWNFVGGALASVALASGNLSKSQTILDRTSIPELSMDSLGYRRYWVGWVELALLNGEYSQALVWVNQLIESAPGWQAGKVIPYLEWLKGRALVGRGQEELAIAVYGAALQAALDSGERNLLWRIHTEYGQLLASAGSQQAAEQELATARMQVEELAKTLTDPDLKRGFAAGAARFMS